MAEDNKLNDFPYTKDELLCLGIYELRDLGRDVGVPSPTTLKKEQLVDTILAVIYGEAPKRRIGKGRGRPARNKPKPNRNLIELVNRVPLPEKTDIINEAVGVKYGDSNLQFASGMVASPVMPYKVDGAETKRSVQVGTLIIKDGIGYLKRLKYFSTPFDIIVPNEMIEMYGLKEGDLVEYLESENGKVICQIIKVNGGLAMKRQQPTLSQVLPGKSEAKEEDIRINEEVTIKSLKSNLVFALDTDKREALVDKMADIFSDKDYAVVTVRFDVNGKTDLFEPTCKKVEFFANSSYDEYETMALIESGLDRLDFYRSNGCKAVLIVDNLKWLKTVVEIFPKSVYGMFLQRIAKLPRVKDSKATVVCLSSYMPDQELLETSSIFENVCLNKEEKKVFEDSLFIKRTKQDL